jgi:hypothetical protein
MDRGASGGGGGWGDVGGIGGLDSTVPSCQGPVFRIHDILVWIRIRGSMPLTNGSGFGTWIRSLDPDPAIFVIDLQDASKKLIFNSFFCLLLFDCTFTSFFKD